MDDDHTIIPHGRVLVRDGVIMAVWRGPQPPDGVEIGDTSVIEAGRQDLVFPGLIDLHNHPRENMLHAWPPPSAHAIPGQGKEGTDPYANRYQWGATGSATAPPELARLVINPADVLAEDLGLGLRGEIVKYAEVVAMLGGATAIQGAPQDPESDGVLIRNIDNDVFDHPHRVSTRPTDRLVRGTELSALLTDMQNGQVDAWMVHLAEGVTDADRRPVIRCHHGRSSRR